MHDDRTEEIDRNLRRVYDRTVNAPLPDRFHRLLRELQDRDGQE